MFGPLKRRKPRRPRHQRPRDWRLRHRRRRGRWLDGHFPQPILSAHRSVRRARSSPATTPSVNTDVRSASRRRAGARRTGAPARPRHRRRAGSPPPPAAPEGVAPWTSILASCSHTRPLLILIGDGLPGPAPEAFAGPARAAYSGCVAGCVAALRPSVLQWHVTPPTRVALRRHARPSTAWRCILDGAFLVAALLTLLFAPPVPARARLRVRRVLRAGPVRHRRHDDGGARRRTW